MNSEEATRKLLHTVTVFAKLIQQVCFSPVTWMNEKEIEKAFQWAAYCQQVAKQIDRMPELRTGFEKSMAELDKKIHPPLPQPINMHLLHHANNILFEALVYNPSFSTNQLDKMWPIVSNEALGSDQVSSRFPFTLERARVINSDSVKAETLLNEMQTKLRKTSTSSSKEEKKDLNSSVRCLLEQLAIFMADSSRTVWFDCRLSTILYRWTQCPQGWSLLVSSLCCDLHTVEPRRRKDMQQLIHVIICWVAQQYRLYDRNCPLWHLPPALLAKLSEFNGDFCSWYIKTLEKIGDCLTVSASNSSSRMLHSADGGDTSARNPLSRHTVQADNVTEQRDLEERFQQLLIMDRDVKRQVLDLLIAKAKQKNRVFNAWTYICTSLMRRNSPEP